MTKISARVRFCLDSLLSDLSDYNVNFGDELAEHNLMHTGFAQKDAEVGRSKARNADSLRGLSGSCKSGFDTGVTLRACVDDCLLQPVFCSSLDLRRTVSALFKDHLVPPYAYTTRSLH